MKSSAAIGLGFSPDPNHEHDLSIQGRVGDSRSRQVFRVSVAVGALTELGILIGLEISTRPRTLTRFEILIKVETLG